MDFQRAILSALAGCSLTYIVSSLYVGWSDRQKSKRIPTIGPSGIFSSYIGVYQQVFRGRDMIQEGYDKYHGSPFKIPGMSKWIVVISGPKMVQEIRMAKDEDVSFQEAASDSLQLDYTLGPEVHRDPYHVEIVRSALTRSLMERFSDVQDEIKEGFGEYIPPTEDWTSVIALPTIMKIVCRTSNRLFVGLPLCRDPDYRTLNIENTINVIKVAFFINMFPNFLKPVIGRLVETQDVSRGMRHLGPIIEERLLQQQKYGKDWPGKPNDAISWLLDVAKGYQRTVRDLTLRILSINFAAIHTTSMAFTQILFDLAANPSFVPELREEVESVIHSEGLNKMALHKMVKLDSFIKESQRLGGNGALSMQRKVLKDFTFSDGTVVPKGHTIAIATLPMHQDENFYTRPDEFDGFRFSRYRDAEAEGFSKHQMVALNDNYVIFGHGRHACPGRFFAVNELKALLGHVLLNYDVAFEGNGGRPADKWFKLSKRPDPSVSVMFRKRR